jgi:hypothetical protein
MNNEAVEEGDGVKEIGEKRRRVKRLIEMKWRHGVESQPSKMKWRGVSSAIMKSRNGGVSAAAAQRRGVAAISA